MTVFDKYNTFKKNIDSLILDIKSDHGDKIYARLNLLRNNWRNSSVPNRDEPNFHLLINLIYKYVNSGETKNNL